MTTQVQQKSFPVLLQQFFLQRLIQQRHASAQTIVAYRDSFRLLFRFAHQQLGKRPGELALTDLNAAFILEFLRHLEVDRGNSIRSRNARFAAIRSFMDYVAYEDPSSLAMVQAVRAIPMKRFEQPLIGFLSREHIEAILDAPDRSTRSGQRDRVMLATLYNTGARVSELIGMRIDDLMLEPLQGPYSRQRTEAAVSSPMAGDGNTAQALAPRVPACS